MGQKSNTADRPASSLQQLKNLTAEKMDQHIKSGKTRNAYNRYITRAKSWLGVFFLEEGEAERKWKEGSGKGLSGDGEGDIDNTTLLEDEEFRDAFDGVPSKSTPQAISMFLTFKCFEENKGRSTAEGIHAAFITEYDKIATYWPGIHSGMVIHIAASGTLTVHGGIGSEIQPACPLKTLDAIPLDLATRNVISHHLHFRAFASTGWTVWSRRGGSPGDPDFFTLSLEHRKNWQKNLDKTENNLRGKFTLSGHRYHIYQQPNLPSADLYNHMLDWLDCYELLIDRLLQPDDYLFPLLHINGVIEPHQMITSDMAQKMITEYATTAGAQYRFMFAPIGERWTLARIQWWGGWADGEHLTIIQRDTLIKYLLDELHSYEQDHSDALCPIPRNASLSHAGAAALVEPLCRDEARHMLEMHSVETKKVIQETMMGVLTSVCEQWLQHHHGPVISYHHSEQPIWPSTPLLPSAPSFPSSLPSASTMGLVLDHRGSLDKQTPNPNLMLIPTRPQSPSRTPPANSSSTCISPAVVQIIPRVPNGESGWRQVVKDWENADPNRGLDVPLRDWPASWYSRSSSTNSTQGALQNNRKMIAYEHHEANFMAAYPMHQDSITTLLAAIRAVHQESGKAQSRKRRPTA
ncbi:hypothetical protein FIBSPDRAFT_1019175 [Athelia psychrophila]|uniref:Uncharacterized protein n=1 Tax=Athelia psychrophila TaxID=1759441 RepID=A0A167TSR6_9AGAM|nr:hypothetical protein FIBSPDRAFT_1019175 [Fibularhizoctonia sp. CBS 109695]